MEGYINSIETLGALDGPGIRVVVFMQGCGLRCLFCHNPETWGVHEGVKMHALDVVNQVIKYKNYFGDRGGVTFSGGEPLMQPQFLLEVLKVCKDLDIHTCLDTAGFGGEAYWSDILDYTDLVLLDIKSIDEDQYKEITGQGIASFLSFVKLCQQKEKALWIRQVIIPGMNDTEDYILRLKSFISKLEGVERIELLPYHLMGIEKYRKLGIPYRLDGVEAMDHQRCDELYRELIM